MYDTDNDKHESMWTRIAKVVLTEQGQKTFKYIKSYKTVYQEYEDSGTMPFRFVNSKDNKMSGKAIELRSVTKSSSKVPHI